MCPDAEYKQEKIQGRTGEERECYSPQNCLQSIWLSGNRPQVPVWDQYIDEKNMDEVQFTLN